MVKTMAKSNHNYQTPFKAFKVFNDDWTCNHFQYMVGQTYTMTEELNICQTGFHFCPKLMNCFSYYDFNATNKVAEVEILGKVEWDETKSKGCTNQIKIIREISWYEVLDLVNSGDGNSGNRNSGDGNSGNRNSGDGNTGDWNSGDGNSGNRNSGDGNSGNRNSGDGNSGNRNSGDGNSGDWNSGKYNMGFCNTITETTVKIFNKSCLRSKWENVTKPNFFYRLDISLNWKVAYRNASPQDKALLLKLPNFNKQVWLELTGIDLDNAETWLFDDHIGIQNMMEMFD